MALITCPECGKEISDKAKTCPNCGAPVEVKAEIPEIEVQSKPDIADRYRQQQTEKEPKNSALGIMAVIFSAIGCTFFVGIIMGIVDLTKKDGRKHTAAYWAIGIGLFWLILVLIANAGGTNTQPSTQTKPKETAAIEETVEESVYETVESIVESESETETFSETESVITETKDEFIASCVEIPYKNLLRNPDDYIGQRICIVAEVKQIMQGGIFDKNQYYRLQTDNDGYGYYFDDEYFMYDYRIDDDTKILEEDILKVYAEFTGLQTVTRVLTDTSDEVPAIKVYYAELLAE